MQTMQTMQISQIYLCNDAEVLPPILSHFSKTVEDAFPEDSHVVYYKNSMRQFIDDHFDQEILSAYDSVRPYSYKSNLGRLCLLYVLGGWYFDIGVRAINHVKLAPDISFFAFRDGSPYARVTWTCMDAILFSKKHNPLLKNAIEKIVWNCKNRYYGITPLCPTGPSLLGSVLAAYGGQEDFIYGDILELTPSRVQKNRAFVLPDGTILAWLKPTQGGDLKSLRGEGVNNYNELWNSRAVYVD